MKKIKITILALLGIFAALQVFQIDKTNPPIVAEMDFLQVTQTPPAIATILKNTCYDCHSQETFYPWYSYTNPLGWWIRHNVNEGREDLNFSTWGYLSQEEQENLVTEAIKEIESNKMPLKSYTFAHSQAKLSSADKAQLLAWFRTLID